MGRRRRPCDARQEDAADRARRDQRHRGGAVALARVQPAGARLPRAAGDVPRRRRSTPRVSSSKTWKDKGVSLLPRDRSRHRRTRSSTSATRWSAASRRRRSRCAARSSWRYDLEEEIRVIRKGQAVRAIMPIPVRRRRARPQLEAAERLRSRAREQAARLLQLQEGQGRLSHAARRQAAGAAPCDRARAPSIASSTSCGRRTWTPSASASSSSTASSPTT